MTMQSQDIIRRLGTNSLTPAPHVRDHKLEVTKLIDVSVCIGRKACQVACNEWNDLRDEVGHNAGVYDPQGVGGTHVMYMLQNADKPDFYHKLPEDPKINNVVQSWKGWFKPLGALGFLTALAGAAAHYISAGANEVEDDDAAGNGDQKKDGSQA